MGYSLQTPAKQKEGTTHPDRNAQFAYLNSRVTPHLRAGERVISVDTKKKELVSPPATSTTGASRMAAQRPTGTSQGPRLRRPWAG